MSIRLILIFMSFFSGSAPLAALTKNSAYFVSDWTGDSNLTHYLTGKTMGV